MRRGSAGNCIMHLRFGKNAVPEGALVPRPHKLLHAKRLATCVAGGAFSSLVMEGKRAGRIYEYTPLVRQAPSHAWTFVGWRRCAAPQQGVSVFDRPRRRDARDGSSM